MVLESIQNNTLSDVEDLDRGTLTRKSIGCDTLTASPHRVLEDCPPTVEVQFQRGRHKERR